MRKPNLLGRGVLTYGVMQKGTPTSPWWRYPVTYLVYRFWYRRPVMKQTEKSIAALHERIKVSSPRTRRTETGWVWIDCGCRGDRNAQGQMHVTQCDQHMRETRAARGPGMAYGDDLLISASLREQPDYEDALRAAEKEDWTTGSDVTEYLARLHDARAPGAGGDVDAVDDERPTST